MISWMQKHRKYLVVTIWISTIAFIGAGFVGWGAYSFSENKASTVAKVGDRTITGKDLQSSYNNIYNYYNQLMGGKMTKEKAEELQLVNIAKKQLIQEYLLLNYADDLGITATKEEIGKKLYSIESFQKDGKFDKQIYFKVLKSIRQDASDFEASLKKELTVEKLNSALKLPHTELELEMLGAGLYLQDNISAKVIEVKDSDVNITNEELKVFWENNKYNYMSEKSYVIDTIKILSSDMEVTDNAMKEFYESKKHLFKADNDKILKYEEAIDRVKEKLQLKYAKKETLKKYLRFKDAKLSKTDTLTLTKSSSIIPLDKILTANEGDFIKAIELKDGYMTAKLTAINEPSPLGFDKAKTEAKNNLLSELKQKLVKEKAELSLADLSDAKEIGFVSKNDSLKITDLNDNEAKAFLNHLFSKTDKKGYYLFADHAIVYKITDQNLLSKKNIEENKAKLVKNIESLKMNTIKQNLIAELKNRYKIEEAK